MKKLLYAFFIIQITLNSFQSTAQQQFTVYNESNSGLPFNTVYCVTIDQNDAKWVGTDYGLAKFDGTNWTVWRTTNSSIPDNSIRALTFAPNGDLWIGTYQSGLVRFDGTNFTTLNTTNSGISDNTVKCIFFDHNGLMWIGTSGGINTYDGTNWEVYDHTSVAVIHSDNILKIKEDTSNVIWIGTNNGGLMKYDQGVFTVYSTTNSNLPDNTILGLDIDDQQNKWLANPYGGINVLTAGGSWLRFTSFNSNLPANSYWDVLVSGQTTYLASQFKGLSFSAGATWTTYDTLNSDIPDNTVHCLTEDNSGKIWLGTFSGGLAVFDPTAPVATHQIPDNPMECAFYPNPVIDVIVWNMPQDGTYIIMNSMGQTVMNGTASVGRNLLDVRQLANGTYLMSVSNKNGETWTQRIVVAK